MQALRVGRLSDDLSGITLADIPAPARAPGEVLVQVRAASLNFPDLLMTRGHYQFRPEPPLPAASSFPARCWKRTRRAASRRGIA